MITLIYGCMKAGKSKYLIDTYNDLISKGFSIDVFQPVQNTREKGFLKSRAYPDVSIEAKITIDTSELLKSKADYIIVDEFQFLNPDYFKATLKELKKRNKNVIVAGLNYMASGKEFGTFTAIKDLATHKVHLTTKCCVDGCNLKASRTLLKRLKGATDWIENEFNIYTPVCEKHFIPFN